jgi:hypothetical protein
MQKRVILYLFAKSKAVVEAPCTMMHALGAGTHLVSAAGSTPRTPTWRPVSSLGGTPIHSSSLQSTGGA